MQSLISWKPRAMEVANFCGEAVQVLGNQERDVSWNKVQPRHTGCQGSNLCAQGRARRRAWHKPRLSPVSWPALRRGCQPAGGQSPDPPAHRAWAACKWPRDRSHPSSRPPALARGARRGVAAPGQSDGRACPCFAFQGGARERCSTPPAPRWHPSVHAAIAPAATQPSRRAAGSSAPAASCAGEGPRPCPAGMSPQTPHGYVCAFFTKKPHNSLLPTHFG